MISLEPFCFNRTGADRTRSTAGPWSRLTLACALAMCVTTCAQVAVAAAPDAITDVLDAPAPAVDARLPAPVLAVASVAGALISVGPHGLIQRSSDAGTSWQQVPSPVSSDLIQVRFVDEHNGWIVGHDSLVMHSADAGNSWQVQLDGRSLLKLLTDYYQPLADQGDEAAALMLAETATAASASATPGTLAGPFLDVLFDGQGNGFVVGAFGMMLHSSDNGAHWQPWVERSDNDRRMHLYGLAQRDGVFYVSGEQGLLLKQDIAAKGFKRIELPYAGTLFGVTATRDLLLVHGLRGNLYASRDDGQQWQPIETGINASLVSIVAEDGQLIVVGQGGQLLALDPDNLQTGKLRAVPGAEVYGAVTNGRPGQLLVTRYSGASVVDLAKAD